MTARCAVIPSPSAASGDGSRRTKARLARFVPPPGGAAAVNELAPGAVRRNISGGWGDWRSGSAAALHAVGRGFESLIAHQFEGNVPALFLRHRCRHPLVLHDRPVSVRIVFF